MLLNGGLKNLAYTNPTIADFKAQFGRDFPYGTDPSTVMDSDINSALALMIGNINPDLFVNQAAFSSAALQLSAHYLVMNLRASAQGIAGQANWLQVGKSVGPVSESFQVPQYILDNPVLSQYSKTNYGMMYLNQVLPLLTGQMFSVCGRTNP